MITDKYLKIINTKAKSVAVLGAFSELGGYHPHKLFDWVMKNGDTSDSFPEGVYPEDNGDEVYPNAYVEILENQKEEIVSALRWAFYLAVEDEYAGKSELILMHRVRYHFDDDDVIMNDHDREHVAYLISQGYCEGELLHDDDGDDQARGWWKLPPRN